jgi:hypothetical protein
MQAWRARCSISAARGLLPASSPARRSVLQRCPPGKEAVKWRRYLRRRCFSFWIAPNTEAVRLGQSCAARCPDRNSRGAISREEKRRRNRATGGWADALLGTLFLSVRQSAPAVHRFGYYLSNRTVNPESLCADRLAGIRDERNWQQHREPRHNRRAIRRRMSGALLKQPLRAPDPAFLPSCKTRFVLGAMRVGPFTRRLPACTLRPRRKRNKGTAG